jgi:hypothetical protein
MKFFADFKQSIYGPDYYQNVLVEPFSRALKYFFILIFFAAVLSTAFFSITFIPKLSSFISTEGTNLVDKYPPNLTITIKNGKASTNVQEPYFIKLPAPVKSQQAKGSQIENILVLDTNHSFSLDHFKMYKTACVLNDQSFACYDKNQSIKITSFPDTMNFSLDKAVLINFMARIKPFLTFLYPILMMFFFIGLFVAYTILYLVYLLFGALVIWLVVRLKGLHMGYVASYKLGLHLITLPLIINLLLYAAVNLSGMPFQIPFFFTILLVATTLLNIAHANVSVAQRM